MTLPGAYVPFRLNAWPVGWLAPEAAGLLTQLPFGCVYAHGGVVLREAAVLPQLARRVADVGAFTWRDEPFDVWADDVRRPVAQIDRGALPWFGMRAEGVHVNGLVQRADGLHVWIARRAANRLMDPGKLDHMFAGGISAGMAADETLLKEGAEEAGLDAACVNRATYVGSIRYTTQRPEGLRRDRLHCYDLRLSEDVVPVPADGEVAGFELWPIKRVEAVLRETDDFKFNVALVLIDLLLRQGALPAGSEEARLLREALGR